MCGLPCGAKTKARHVLVGFFNYIELELHCVALLITVWLILSYIIQPFHHLHNAKHQDGLTLEMVVEKTVNHRGTMMRVLVRLHHHLNIVPLVRHVVLEKTTHKTATVDGVIAAVVGGMTSLRITHRMNRISTTSLHPRVEVAVLGRGIGILTRLGEVLGVDAKVVGVVTDVKVAGVAIEEEMEGAGVRVRVDDSLIAAKTLDQAMQKKEALGPISKRSKMQDMSTYMASHQY